MRVQLLGSNHNNCRMDKNEGKRYCARFRCEIVGPWTLNNFFLKALERKNTTKTVVVKQN